MDLEELARQRAMLLAGPLEEPEAQVLGSFCSAGARWAQRQLRPEVDPSHCRESLSTAAALYAMSLYEDLRSANRAERLSLGELSLSWATGTGAEGLRAQARRLLESYGKDCFGFWEV